MRKFGSYRVSKSRVSVSRSIEMDVEKIHFSPTFTARVGRSGSTERNPLIPRKKWKARYILPVREPTFYERFGGNVPNNDPRTLLLDTVVLTWIWIYRAKVGVNMHTFYIFWCVFRLACSKISCKTDLSIFLKNFSKNYDSFCAQYVWFMCAHMPLTMTSTLV